MQCCVGGSPAACAATARISQSPALRRGKSAGGSAAHAVGAINAVDTINAVDLIKALDRSVAVDAIDASTGEGIVAREVVRQFNVG